MKCSHSRVYYFALTAISLIILFAGRAPSAFGADIFFSTSNSLAGAITIGNPTQTFTSASGSGKLYVWVTDEIPVVPPPGDFSLAAMSLGLGKSGTSATVSGAVALNFNLHSTLASTGADLGPTAQNRWDNVSSAPQPINAFAANVLVFNAQVGAGTPGINPLNDGVHLNPGSATNGTLDVGYNVGAHVFLYGELDYSVIGFGSTTFSLQPVASGIIATNGTINMDFTNQYTYGSATIDVVPEPTAIGLMGAGAVVFAVVVKRRRMRTAL